MHPVLVVDDDDNYRELVLLALEDHCGLEDLHGFGSGEELLAHLDAHPQQLPRLVLLDLHMDGMDGLAVLAGICRRDPRVPIAFLSGAAGPDERSACLAAGACAFLAKPVAYARLTGELERLLQSVPPPTA